MRTHNTVSNYLRWLSVPAMMLALYDEILTFNCLRGLAQSILAHALIRMLLFMGETLAITTS